MTKLQNYDKFISKYAKKLFICRLLPFIFVNLRFSHLTFAIKKKKNPFDLFFAS